MRAMRMIAIKIMKVQDWKKSPIRLPFLRHGTHSANCPTPPPPRNRPGRLEPIRKGDEKISTRPAAELQVVRHANFEKSARARFGPVSARTGLT
jgi:hypothetical protein